MIEVTLSRSEKEFFLTFYFFAYEHELRVVIVWVLVAYTAHHSILMRIFNSRGSMVTKKNDVMSFWEMFLYFRAWKE